MGKVLHGKTLKPMGIVKYFDRSTTIPLIKFVVLSILLLFLCGCGVLATKTTPTQVPPAMAERIPERSLLFPSLLGKYHAGITTFEDAKKIIYSRNDVTEVQVVGLPADKILGKLVDILWVFSDDRTNGLIRSDLNGENVFGIYFIPQENLRLDQVIEKFGEPDQVYILTEGEAFYRRDIYLNFTRLKMVLEFVVESKTRVVQIEKEANIFKINFNSESSLDKFFGSMFYLSNLIEWHGYGEYPIPDQQNRQINKTP